jgi:hypothetical protein
VTTGTAARARSTDVGLVVVAGVMVAAAIAQPAIHNHDFHGNLEAASLNLYGQFAGGGAYLAKAIKDP